MVYKEEKNKKIILAGIGEIILKGLNRNKFESQLIGNIKRRIQPFGKFFVEQKHSRIWIIPEEDIDLDQVTDKIKDVFGLVFVSITWRTTKDFKSAMDLSIEFVEELLQKNPRYKTFKVESRRSDKTFKLTSPQISKEIGKVILDNFENLTVDVKKPDFILRIEVRGDYIYIFSQKKSGLKGLPVGISGKGTLLLSGGIDSPVAGFMMASRGMQLDAVYFHSHPYTSDDTKEKVIELAKTLTKYTGRIKLYVVDFTSIQLELKEKCYEDMLVLITRRFMMRIASKIAKKTKSKALITGESLGQVASQTIEAIACTDAVSSIPVLRPLIGMDKEETIKIAKKIGTYNTSILPYDDCCTLFVAKHPKTHPSIAYAKRTESELDIDELVSRAVSNIEEIMIN